jgi:hypothetical protein
MVVAGTAASRSHAVAAQFVARCLGRIDVVPRDRGRETVALSPPPVEVPVEPAPIAVAIGEPASSALPPSSGLDGLSTLPALAPGFGQLTVRSTASHASVYVDQKLSGSPGEKLSVRCGKHFVSIGIPARLASKPTWLAPGKTVLIPCGAALETTMNPRALH